MRNRVPSLVGLILLSTIAINACYAQTELPDIGELCKTFALYIPAAAITYSASGTVDAEFTPRHSRLYYAAVLGRIQDLKRLLRSLPDGVPQDKKVLLDAIAADQTPSVVALLQAGVAPDFRAADEPPPLVVAAQCVRPQIMVYLIRAGANIYASDDQGVDAMVASMMSRSPEVATILLSAGYDPFTCALHGRLDLLKLAKKLHAPKIEAMLSAAREIASRPADAGSASPTTGTATSSDCVPHTGDSRAVKP